MFSADLYTKLVLTIIALCLAVLCIQGSQWSRLDTVHAQSGQVLISGYTYYDNGIQKVFTFGTGTDHGRGIPVVVMNK